MTRRALPSIAPGLVLIVVLCSAIGRAAQQPRTPIDFASDVQPILQAQCLSCHGETMARAARSAHACSNADRRGQWTGAGAGQRRCPGGCIGASPDSRSRRLQPSGPERPGGGRIKQWIDDGAEWPASVVLASRGPRATGDRRAAPDRSGAQLLDVEPPVETPWCASRAPASDRSLPRRTTASARAGTGSTWRATPTPADSSTTCIAPTPGATATTSSARSTRTSPTTRFLTEQIAGDEMDGKTDDSLIATGFLRAGPRVLFREKDNPERRFDYLDDMIGTIGKGTLGLTVNCARCHNHKFDPIRRRTTTRCRRRSSATSRPSAAGAARPKPTRISRRTRRSTRSATACAASRRDREAASRSAGAASRSSDSPNVSRPRSKPEAERTPGEQLLATQVLERCASRPQIDKAMTPEELAQKQELTAQIAALEKAAAAPLPMAEIAPTATSASRRSAKATTSSAVRSAAFRRHSHGSYLHEGPGKYEAAAHAFPDSRRSGEPRAR